MVSGAVKIYVEGGGDHNRALRDACHRGFSEFFRKLNLKRNPKVIPCGGRTNTYEDFCIATSLAKDGDLIILLVDSEGEIGQFSPWQYLKQRRGDEWVAPARSTDKQVHFMVQSMEAWLLADPECLKAYFGKNFNQSALPKNIQNVESIGKDKLEQVLAMATLTTSSGKYEHDKRSFEILERIDPFKVIALSPYAQRLYSLLKDHEQNN